jgi:hypothetical protein
VPESIKREDIGCQTLNDNVSCESEICSTQKVELKKTLRGLAKEKERLIEEAE